MRLRGWGATAAAVAARPGLWAPAARQVRRLARPGWWRRPPFLPVPDPEWLAFRLETQYGDPGHRAVPEDVVAWLAWERDAGDHRRRPAAHAARPGPR